MTQSKSKVLITRRVYPEALELLRGRAEVDYHDSDDRLETAELLRRAHGAAARPASRRLRSLSLRSLWLPPVYLCPRPMLLRPMRQPRRPRLPASVPDGGGDVGDGGAAADRRQDAACAIHSRPALHCRRLHHRGLRRRFGSRRHVPRRFASQRLRSPAAQSQARRVSVAPARPLAYLDFRHPRSWRET